MSATIRLATIADGPALAAIYAPAVLAHATSFELEAPDGAEMARRVETLTTRTPWLVCEFRSAVVGYAYASPHRDRWAYQWSVEVSAYVGAAAQRSGVARALYTSLFAVLVMQGFRNAYAGSRFRTRRASACTRRSASRLWESTGVSATSLAHGTTFCGWSVHLRRESSTPRFRCRCPPP
jgi:L-amino acid N-acyltransferase YncA